MTSVEQQQTPAEAAYSKAYLNLASRSCKEETADPVIGKKTGDIPKWLKGCLLRNGPGMMEVGEDKYQHWFDGLAILQSFTIKDGEATYRSKFVRSNSFQKNTAANRIVVSEFGTAAHVDPCSSIFDRFKSFFTREVTDNTNINVLKIGDQYYASTETNFIHRIDLETLDTKDRVNLSNTIAVNTATAHTHTETDGTVYNLGNCFSGFPSYNFIRFPPSVNENAENNASFEEASIVCKIPSSRRLYPSYYHSFGMTENYLIFAEQSVVINIPKLLWNMTAALPFNEALRWEPEQMVRFHLVDKRTGKSVPTKYVANPFMVFHHANAFEEDGHVVVDLCAYDSGEIINALSLEELRRNHLTVWQKNFSQVRRYVLPLLPDTTADASKNLVALSGSASVAYRQKDGSILCHHENLSQGLDLMEMPQVNYEKYNGKKYRFLYGIGKRNSDSDSSLVKLNVEDKSMLNWLEDGKSPTEPIFVANPDAREEDDGLLLASLLHLDDESKVTLLILDAKNMKEIARVEFNTKSAVTNSFHGPYVAL